MAVDKFKFVSPGIFIDEIDESVLQPLPERMGPLIIGRFAKGPSKRPIVVESFKDLVATFGAPSDGNVSGDNWRSNLPAGPTYAAYAAQAWLKNNSPCTIYRVLGENKSNAETGQGEAGWNLTNGFSKTAEIGDSGGAYGLVVFPSGALNAPGSGSQVTGTLAAIWYVDAGAVMLSGTTIGGTSNSKAAGTLFRATNNEFKAIITGSDGEFKSATFNFDRDSHKFIRKVFNTNATLLNSALTNTQEKYFLGETFESNITQGRNSELKVDREDFTGTVTHGVILALDGTNKSNIKWADHKQQAKAAQTGFFFSQHIDPNPVGFNPESASDVKKLFKFHALDSGEHANRDFKISIQDIKPSQNKFNDFGTFTVLVRKGDDTDQKPIVLERYSNVNLNPRSLNYIARVIGDRHFYYNSDTKVLTELGNYPNKSSIVRIEVSPEVELGDAKNGWLPYGVYGPVVPLTQAIFSSGSTGDSRDPLSGSNGAWLAGSGTLADNLTTAHAGDVVVHHDRERLVSMADADFSGSVVFPRTRIRVSSSEGDLVKATRAYFGYQSNIINTKRYDHTNIDLLRGMPAGIDPHVKGDKNQYSWVFTLDNLIAAADDPEHVFHEAGSRAAQKSLTSLSGSTFVLTGSSGGVSYAFNRFTSPMFGGFDGFDIKEKDPFRNRLLANSTEVNNYAYYSLKKAIDITADPEFVEYDLALMPGIENSSLNTQLINSCEERGDALAIIDLAGNYTPPEHSALDESSRLGSVDEVVSSAKDLALKH